MEKIDKLIKILEASKELGFDPEDAQSQKTEEYLVAIFENEMESGEALTDFEEFTHCLGRIFKILGGKNE